MCVVVMAVYPYTYHCLLAPIAAPLTTEQDEHMNSIPSNPALTHFHFYVFQTLFS